MWHAPVKMVIGFMVAAAFKLQSKEHAMMCIAEVGTTAGKCMVGITTEHIVHL